MSHSPEEELLDHALRETFSEFELPPAHHVWTGIEDRISILPGTAWAAPRRFLLPAVALVGLGAGWLLASRPQPVPAPAPVARPAAVASRPAGHAPAATAEAAPAPAVAAPVAARRHPAGTATAGFRRRALAPSAPLLAATEVTAAEPRVVQVLIDESQWQMVDVSSSSLQVPAAPQPSVVAATDAENSARPAEAGLRIEGMKERRTEYRVPTHRLSEKGRGTRQRVARLGQWLHQLVAPRRPRATAQPDF